MLQLASLIVRVSRHAISAVFLLLAIIFDWLSARMHDAYDVVSPKPQRRD
jgi:hypothetical protein